MLKSIQTEAFNFYIKSTMAICAIRCLQNMDLSGAATGNMQKITSILRCQMSGLRKVRAEKCNATQKFVHKSVAKYIFTSIKMLTISS